MNRIDLIQWRSIFGLSMAFSSLMYAPVYAQELTLFQPFESDSSAEVSGTAQSSTEVRVTGEGPVFKLLGTMRIGDSRRIHLSHRSGEIVKIAAGPDFDRPMPIPGYPGYAVFSGQNQQVAITLPANETCQVFPESGISCRDSSTAELALVLGGVVKPKTPVDSNEEVVEENPDNPFARIRAANAAYNPASEPESQRFRPRRIPPEDVPEGMRVISTPFGDRLVQE